MDTKVTWMAVDDMRDLGCDVTARTYKEALCGLEKHWHTLEHLCLDHDLGDEDGNGYDVACFAADHGLLPAHVQIVSANPVGKCLIQGLLRRHGYTSLDGVNFRKAEPDVLYESEGG